MNTLLLYTIIFASVLLSVITFAQLSLKKEIRWDRLLTYVAFMSMLGPVGEVFVGTLYMAIASHPLWQYQLYPIHSGFTSLIAPLIWGFTGAFLYLSHETFIIGKRFSGLQRSIFIMFETITFEAVFNVTFLALNGILLFYYTPGDLLHITSLQTLPFYFVLGMIIIHSTKRILSDWKFFSPMFLLIMFVFVYMSN